MEYHRFSYLPHHKAKRWSKHWLTNITTRAVMTWHGFSWTSEEFEGRLTPDELEARGWVYCGVFQDNDEIGVDSTDKFGY